MASNPPGQCCATGFLHEGTPTGKLITIGNGIQAYLATPAAAKAHGGVGILYMPDIIGIWQNSMLMADVFALEGYTCLVLDLFNGDPAPLNMDGFDIMSWLAKGSSGDNPHTKEFIDPIILSGIKFLRDSGVTRIGAAGYCFGAKYVVRHYKDGIECGFIAHPSFVEAEELAAITGPLSIAAAETDDIFPTEKRHESEKILIGTKQDYQINLFSGVEHGFSVRGDPNVKVQRFAKEQAFRQAVAWFDNHLVDKKDYGNKL
ncbi:dienelactone hydrolase [Dactylonectria macrodidyma]|uniref:Dienelactone hydrolase n=1 Tax=Dactylonectria macrodidyma TaxID=307937 RepID=A0A9P9EYS0_9HYPO|nr:dienelactone hydrolase [Dactylonectria macrodidyma]